MKLEFIRTRQGNFVAKNNAVSYIIEKANDVYSIDISGMIISERFEKLADAQQHCQDVEDLLFDVDVINSSIKVAMEAIGGEKEFYEYISGKNTVIVLNARGDAWIKIDTEFLFFPLGKSQRVFGFKVHSSKYCTKIHGVCVVDLIKKELLPN